jgi:hypothetical protein
MTPQLDVDRVLEDWLAEGPSRLPDRVLRATVDQLDEIKQRRLWWLPGSERMHRIILPVTGVAAALVVAVVTLVSLNGGPGPGGPPGTPYTSERHAYTVVLPDGWTRDERPGTWGLGTFFEANTPAGVDYFEDLNQDGEVTLFAYLASQSIPDTMTFDAWAAGHDAANAQAVPCFKQQGRFEAATVDGETARVGVHRCDDYEGGFDTRGAWTTVQVLVAHDGLGYAIYFWPGPGPGSDMPLADLRAMANDWLSRFSFTD